MRLYNGRVIGVKGEDQRELAKFYTRNDKKQIENFETQWKSNTRERELQFRAEEAYKINKLIQKEKERYE